MRSEIFKPMDPEVRFRRIEVLLHAMAERENQMEIRLKDFMNWWRKGNTNGNGRH